MASCDYVSDVNDSNVSGISDELLAFWDDMEANMTESRRDETLSLLSRYVYDILIPAVLSFGVLGNVMNLVVFTRRRLRSGMDEIERSATSGLIALALSDLFFCLVGVPAAFLPHSLTNKAFGAATLYYQAYKGAFFNLFSFLSTWLTVLVSAERYFAVCHPFHARWFIRVRRTILIHSSALVLAVLVNIPEFMRNSVQKNSCGYNCKCYQLELSAVFASSGAFDEAYKVTWAVFGIFIPLGTLTYCNGRLIVEIYRSRQRVILESDRYSTSRITMTLLAVVIFFFFLVVPSMLLNFFEDYVVGMSEKALRDYRIAIILTNLTQAVNFAINFLLYCAICKQFRDTLGNTICRKSTSRTSSDTTSRRYQLVNVHI